MTSTELAAADQAALEAIQAAQAQEDEGDPVVTPILKIAQPLTREVGDGLAAPGEFVESITGDSLGNKIGFVVAFFHKGRFAADRATGRAYSATGDLIPDTWSDLVGPEFVGTRFDEHPDAEEVYSNRANSGEIQWGSGPLISTTHNFTGLAVIEPLEGEGDDAEVELRPVRLSLQRSQVGAARKWKTLNRSNRNGQWWDNVYELTTRSKEFSRGTSYLLEVRKGGATNPAQKTEALKLATAIVQGRVNDNAEKDGGDAPAAPPEAGSAAPL